MVLAKSKNAVGLGNSLMNDRFGKGKGADMRRGNHQGIQRSGPGGEKYLTTAKQEPSWVKMRSVTEQAALDEFLSTAELAGTDFTAEKLNNVKVIHRDQRNPYLLSAAEERLAVRKHNANRQRLTVPRRPPWDEHTTPRELDARERESFLDWRRGLASLQESDDLLMTPFERNLEVWRQLWRVIERSDLVVQIVDARNPLLFRSEDLESYVKEVDERKRNLLLVNKADMLTVKQRRAWAGYFRRRGIEFRFFSAELAKEMNEAREAQARLERDGEMEQRLKSDAVKDGTDSLAHDADKLNLHEREEKAEKEEKKEELIDEEAVQVSGASNVNGEEGEESYTRIITTTDLEEVFLQHAPTPSTDQNRQNPTRKVSIGMVGYPNVGKSSTINALIGAKKVSVSATPGKTKHFQTIHLSDSVVLCDCPGLVFPNFATTKAELACNGILSIDQLREFTGPAALVAQRIPQAYLEAVYGIKIQTRPLEEGGTGTPTAEELLAAYATARGFHTQGLGQPDESRAARYVLKDYVKGKLLFCHPPPEDPAIDEREFNEELYDKHRLPLNRQRLAMMTDDDELDPDLDVSDISSSAHQSSTSTKESSANASHARQQQSRHVEGSKTSRLDKKFFGAPKSGNAGHLSMPFHTAGKGSAIANADRLVTMKGMDGSGKQLTGRKEKVMLALEKGVDPAGLKAMGGKKHFKGQKGKGMGKGEYE